MPHPHRPAIYLASASPRRRELLQQIGIPVELIRSEVDETPLDNEAPADYVLRLAADKARAGWAALDGERTLKWLLAADTTVALNGMIFGKPADAADAHRILAKLSGSTHEVLTAVAISDGRRFITTLSRSLVTMRNLKDEELAGYIASGEPMDKAGAYGIQGLGAVLIEKLEGSFSGVVGLPLAETAQALVDMDYPLWTH